MSDGPLVLGIETSCDETGVGIVRGQTLLADAVASSVEEHARFGGVVPEVASRAHLEAMVPTIERACREAGIRLDDLDAAPGTRRPGAAGAGAAGVAGDPPGVRVAGDRRLPGASGPGPGTEEARTGAPRGKPAPSPSRLPPGCRDC